MEWALLPFSRWSDSSGRSRRKEYWSFVGLCLIGGFAIGLIEGMLGLTGLLFGWSPLSLILSVALFMPGLAVTVRRLHDTGKSGWFAAIGLVPLVGGIVLLVLCALDGEPNENRFGPDPIAGERAALPA